MKWQVGQFFLFLGLIVLTLFFVTTQTEEPNYVYFCSGFLITILGGYLMWVGRNPLPPADRFRMLRRLREKEKKEDKKKGEDKEIL